jgi:hypothetical protein
MTAHCQAIVAGRSEKSPFQVRLPGESVSEESDSHEINIEVAGLITLASNCQQSFTAQLGEL